LTLLDHDVPVRAEAMAAARLVDVSRRLDADQPEAEAGRFAARMTRVEAGLPQVSEAIAERPDADTELCGKLLLGPPGHEPAGLVAVAVGNQ
jgi:hypothetical protein